jgi:hypothetical protein
MPVAKPVGAERRSFTEVPSMLRALLTLVSLSTLSTLAIAGTVTGCSSSDATEASGDGGTVAISAACAADNRKDIYTAGLAKTASDLSVSMTSSEFLPSGSAADPGPVQKGMNTVTILVTDANKAPVDGANVSLVLLMPDHGHGSAVTPTVKPLGGGKYEVDNVWLSMAGLWRFTFSIIPTGANAPKEAVYQFCIDG